MTPAAKNTAIAFSITTLVALLVYSVTLAPQVTFGHSGIFSAAAMYPGPSTPSGHPLWAICGWVWIKLFPFGNIAWRLAFGSAIVAAVSCGIVAAIVARTTNETSSSTIGGIVAGLGLAFEQGFWSKAVVVDSWPLTALLFTSILYCASRWFLNPTRRRWLYAAAFLAGAGLSETQALAPPIYALPLFAALADLKVGRDLLLVQSIALWTSLTASHRLFEVGWNMAAVWGSVGAMATVTTIAWALCWWRSGKPIGELRCLATCAAMFAAGLLLCFVSPILSMTNPPVNWGYPRTGEGFAHVLSRGQFDSFAPPPTISQLSARMSDHIRDLLFDIGPMYFVAAVLTITLWKRAPIIVRKWIAAMWLMWIITTLISVAALNLAPRDLANSRSLFTPAIAVFMILAGCGVNLACRPRVQTVPIATRVPF